MVSRNELFLTLCALSFLEVFAQTFCAHYISKDIAAIMYLITGIVIGVVPLLKVEVTPRTIIAAKSNSKVVYVLFSLLAISLLLVGMQKVSDQPLDYTFADMLPVIKIMGERWISGKDVYALIPEIWDGMKPVYLPVMWMSYVPPLFFGLDIRVTNLMILIGVTALILRIFDRPRNHHYVSLVILLPLLLLFSYIFLTYSTFITISEEPVVVGFYCLLVYAVMRSKPWLIIIALAGCLLSRYTLAFWAVIYLVYGYFVINHRRYLSIAIGTGVLCALLLVISQGIYKVDLFLSLKDAYVTSITDPAREWSAVNTMTKNIGLARFVAYENLIYLHTALVWGSLLLPLGLFTLYHFVLKKWVHFALFAACSLKLCLVYFFNVNPLPYSYLFYTSTFLSLIIISQYRTEIIEQKDDLSTKSFLPTMR